MRGIAVFMLSLAMVSGADASSILALSGNQPADPSIVKLGDAGEANSSMVTAGAKEPGATAGPSLVVLGDPAVNAEKVAAIPSGKQPSHGGVLVIRAGVIGGSSAAPAATAAAASATAPADGEDGKPKTLRDAMTQAGQAPAVPQ